MQMIYVRKSYLKFVYTAKFSLYLHSVVVRQLHYLKPSWEITINDHIKCDLIEKKLNPYFEELNIKSNFWKK